MTLLFQRSMPLGGENEDIRSIHEYYTTRQSNAIKRKILREVPMIIISRKFPLKHELVKGAKITL